MLEDLMSTLSVKIQIVENFHPQIPNSVADQKARRNLKAYTLLTRDLLRQEQSGGGSFLGVDCEGTDSQKFSHLPNKAGCMMIQVSSPNVVVVECITSKRGDGRGKGVGLSLPLRDILCDPKITKVFCDQSGDVKALNAEMDLNEVLSCVGSPLAPPNYVEKSKVENIADVQVMAKNKGSNVKKAGLAQVVSYGCGVEVRKQNFKKNAWWRLKSVEEMINARGFTTYAAADAWGTWLAMLYLKNWRDSEGDEQDAEDRKCSSYDQLCEEIGTFQDGNPLRILDFMGDVDERDRVDPKPRPKGASP